MTPEQRTQAFIDEAIDEANQMLSEMSLMVAAMAAESARYRKALEEILTPIPGTEFGTFWRACDGFDVYEPNLSESCLASGERSTAASEHAGYCAVRVAWDALHPEGEL